ncbi:MAG TPA: M13 family metallopeptidase [Acidobacteriaceae bacterium]|nr:M13 family metallopeptidase [Acidobacteriaceae bacterium]
MYRFPAGCVAAVLAFCAFLVASVAGHSQTAVSEQTRIQLHGLDPSLRDTSVDPCVNFFQYACGTWLKHNPIPPDRSSYGIDTQLTENNNLVLKSILERASNPSTQRDPDTQKIGDYYATCMDTQAIDKAGLGELRPMLDRISTLSSAKDLAPLVADLHRDGAQVLFHLDSDEDFKDARHMVATAGQPRLGLPEKGYYLRSDAKSVTLRKQYVDHIAHMLTLAGEPADQAAADAARVLALETKLATASLSREEMRDPAKLYHPTELVSFRTQLGAFDVDTYLHTLGTPAFTSLNVSTPGYFDALNRLLPQTDLASLKALLRWSLLNSTPGTALPAALDNEDFAFYGKTLSGQPEQQVRWKRCVEAVDGTLGEALGRVYVAQEFSPQDKARTNAIMDDIEAAMGRDIQQLDWMSAPTKTKAEEKLKAVTNKIGYPDKWRDYSSLTITRGDAEGNARRAAAFEQHRDLAKIGRPTDKQEWEMSPPTVNAYYDTQTNSVNFPAGILQPPYYDPHMGDAVNYGQAGGLEGHELTHGFDDEGRQFNADGNFNEWWTPTDEKKFQERAACVVKQYDGFVAVDDLHVNGKLTLGENIADIGGVRIGYLAWQHHLQQPGAKPEADLKGLTPTQQFFTAYAQSWCSSTRPETIRLRVQTDPHSPEEYRVNGIVENMPEFQQAFGCKAGQPMVSANRCSIW